jgi:formate hydrogenlyase subunit 6/NADH:ubiquinone oxidoreductase subunit I
MKSICCVVFFCGLCEEACPKTLFIDYSKYWFLLVMKEKILFWKDRLVMPLDMAINAQLKNAN